MPPKLLDRIEGPQDLHALTDDQLQALAQEVREHIIDTVGEIGGHFGANLGACEIAVAVHSVLSSPRDKVLWDVGHHAYPHKILTGRRDQLPGASRASIDEALAEPGGGGRVLHIVASNDAGGTELVDAFRQRMAQGVEPDAIDETTVLRRSSTRLSAIAGTFRCWKVMVSKRVAQHLGMSVSGAWCAPVRFLSYICRVCGVCSV